MRLLLLLPLLGCTGESGAIYDYTLKLVPVTPINQSPFDGLSGLDLVVEPSSGQPQTYALGSVASGASPEVTGLGALDGATLALEGYADASMVAFGRSDPLTLETGETEARILVSEIDRFAWFNSLGTASFGGAMAADGEGRFLLFGGNTGGVAPQTIEDVEDAVWAVDVAPPDGEFTLVEVGTMPTRDDGGAQRMAHTATRLTASGGSQGLIFVAGGQTSYYESQTALGDAFLWDPDTQEAVSQFSLQSERFFHQAVENRAGQVVLIGGMAKARAGYVDLNLTVELVDPEAGTSMTATGETTAGFLYSAATSLGADGVLFCGGVDLRSVWAGMAGCDRVSNSGEIQAAGALEYTFILASLAPLGDGKALLTGGLLTDGAGDLNDYIALDATDRAWVYEDGTLREVEAMHTARAGHGSAPLPDGRVVVFGGMTGTTDGIYHSAASSVACAEIFDPETEKFYEVDECSAADTSGSLPTQTAFPNFTWDDRYGVMTAGGLTVPVRTYSASATGVALFVSCPDAEKC